MNELIIPLLSELSVLSAILIRSALPLLPYARCQHGFPLKPCTVDPYLSVLLDIRSFMEHDNISVKGLFVTWWGVIPYTAQPGWLQHAARTIRRWICNLSHGGRPPINAIRSPMQISQPPRVSEETKLAHRTLQRFSGKCNRALSCESLAQGLQKLAMRCQPLNARP